MDELIANPYVALVVALAVAAVVGTLIHRSGRIVLARLSAPVPIAQTVLQKMSVPAGYALPLLLMQLVLRGAPDDLRGIDPLRHVCAVLLIIAITWLLLRAVSGLARGITDRHPLNVVDNLNARRIHTQTNVLMRTTMVVIVLFGLSAVLMTFPSARTLGASLLASAGVAGIVLGMAAKPVFGNLIAGVQIALTQPIRVDDVLIVEGEWGWVEEITGTYVVMRLWDRRRLIVPLQWFIEHPFQNWTRTSASIIGSVFWWVDYRMPLEPLRVELRRLCEEVPKWWDNDVVVLQVVDSGLESMQLRALVSARNSPDCWDLRCHVREGIVRFVQRDYPEFLPRLRAEMSALPGEEGAPPPIPSMPPGASGTGTPTAAPTA
ncbi:mechanosensitive ion channel family protein [Uliginosibacterium sp. H1]|uniref:mechanosensitive ion channel family protein n=1 Tax=Uliginosibacterium sp. H1 TaxID=3114757 RepID=UPI002E177FBA|nr:mechanosensitive ion channel domain-containing protein [Uliginosibacterium sp. H1]